MDGAAGTFSWSDARDGFCAALRARPMTLRASAKRQFATVCANVCAGDLGLPPVRGRVIKLDRSTRFVWREVSTTVGDWLSATDVRLAQLELLPLGRDARDEYRRIIRVGWHINHGHGIGPVCGRHMTDDDRAVMDGFADDPEEPLAASLMDETENAPARAIGTPNPFSVTTTVSYFVGGAAVEDVAVAVYDVAGRKVRELARGPQAPGTHVLRWDGLGDDGSQVRSGVYFLRGRIGARPLAGQLTFLK
ncbi:MAG: T9SS type A sorting domain-containing protein [Candidatus Eisenbacteria bacterium]|uniref:T9SS type A sorting domain-containing protein n=1 Tax=Eiseniibacteriota bacterium TaxID=2212470 RepID=A0A538SNG1_UNCEI|nr:MAG: T9SS type A sorting domain-containing protein [Candidatus Eisenbacteria bacterium]